MESVLQTESGIDNNVSLHEADKRQTEINTSNGESLHSANEHQTEPIEEESQEETETHQMEINTSNGESLHSANETHEQRNVVNDPLIQPTISAPVRDPDEQATPPTVGKPVFVVENEYNTRAEVDEFLKNEGCWSSVKTEKLNKGIKTTYRCNRVKRRGFQCKAGLYTLHGFDSAVNEKTKVYRRTAEHNCEQSENRVNPKNW